MRLTYIHGNANLDLVLFFYVYYNVGSIVSDASGEAASEKPTLAQNSLPPVS
jgi:hypothetical protein